MMDVKLGYTIKLKELEEIGTLSGNVIWYDKETDEELFDTRYPNTRPPFGKTMIVVKLEEKMSPNYIAIAAKNQQKDWKHWWWIPERWIKEIIKK